jgi:hypothetical protein
MIKGYCPNRDLPPARLLVEAAAALARKLGPAAEVPVRVPIGEDAAGAAAGVAVGVAVGAEVLIPSSESTVLIMGLTMSYCPNKERVPAVWLAWGVAAAARKLGLTPEEVLEV